MGFELNFVVHFFVDIFVKTYIIMTNKEKYERWRDIATSMAEEKKAFLDSNVQKVFNDDQTLKTNDVKYRKLKSLRLQAS
jgi:uncharacterized protein YktA (UPF0223 family)